MRRFHVLLSVVTVALLGILAQPAQPVVVAQDATPAEEMGMEGLTYTPLGILSNLMLPSPADIEVARTVFESGAGFSFDASDPFSVLVIVESGSFTVAIEEQAWTISRGAAIAQAIATPAAEPDMSTIMEDVAMGEEATLQAGDVAYVPGGVNGHVANTGHEAASVLIVQLGPSGSMMVPATPTP
jgi:quercetin dioxygenase-like cupin family protein